MDYISRDKVLNRLRYLCEVASEPPQDNDDVIEWALLQRLEKEFSKIPTADVEEVVHGYWNDNIQKFTSPAGVTKDYLVGYKCSACGRTENRKEPYCNCGAKMDGGKEE